MAKFKVLLERVETITKQGTVTVEASTAEEAKRIILANLDTEPNYYDDELMPVESGIEELKITVEIGGDARQRSQPDDATPHDGVLVAETAAGKFQNSVTAGRHCLLSDEPASVGGLDSGPGPYDFLAIALGTCTSMTLRLYAERKKIQLGRLTVWVRHGKVPAEHCHDCGEVIEGRTGKIDRFERIIAVEGSVDPELANKLIELAGKCPVHRTLNAGAAIVTRVANRS
jgi:uncharacterized OsmC-like protein